MNTPDRRHMKLRIGQPIYCGSCGQPRYFGYGPCSSCNHTPDKESVDWIRRNGVIVDEKGKLVKP